MAQSARELSENSKVQMAQVIAGLVQGRTVRQVAETVGIPVGRITRWHRENDEFKQMLAEVEESVVAQIRSEVVTEATDMVVSLAGRAAEVMEQMLEAEKESVRLAAAAHVLRFSGMGKATATGPSVEDLLRKTKGETPAIGD